jgi:hypothetical protein
MRTLRRVLRGLRLCLVAFVLSGFCVPSPVAWADSLPFFAIARIDVDQGGGRVCGPQEGGPGHGSATAILNAGDCFAGGTGKAAVSMGLGTASVSATGPNLPGFATVAGATFDDPGTISGNGFLSLTGSVSGTAGVLNVELISGDSTVAAACVDFPSGAPDCIAGPSWSIKSLHVTNGMQLAISLSIDCGAVPGTGCTLEDPLTLTLSPGVVFHSSFPGFLTGSTPEPPSLLMLWSGVLGLAGVMRRKLGD